MFQILLSVGILGSAVSKQILHGEVAYLCLCHLSCCNRTVLRSAVHGRIFTNRRVLQSPFEMFINCSGTVQQSQWSSNQIGGEAIVWPLSVNRTVPLRVLLLLQHCHEAFLQAGTHQEMTSPYGRCMAAVRPPYDHRTATIGHLAILCVVLQHTALLFLKKGLMSS